MNNVYKLLIKILARKKNALNKSQKNANANTRGFILVQSWWPTSSSQATRLRFSLSWFWYTPKSTACMPLDKTPFVKYVQLFSTPRRHFLCTTLLYTKKILSLIDYNVSYKAWNLYMIVNKVSYRRTLRILHKRIGIVWRTESETSFL